MYEIIFYEDKNGYSDIAMFIKELEKKSKSSKEERINFNKIVAYFDILQEMGTRIGKPVTKYLEGELWELRPLKNRFIYAYYKDKCFVVLHHFVKKTQKTPRKEIECAKKRLKEFKERNE